MTRILEFTFIAVMSILVLSCADDDVEQYPIVYSLTENIISNDSVEWFEVVSPMEFEPIMPIESLVLDSAFFENVHEIQYSILEPRKIVFLSKYSVELDGVEFSYGEGPDVVFDVNGGWVLLTTEDRSRLEYEYCSILFGVLIGSDYFFEGMIIPCMRDWRDLIDRNQLLLRLVRDETLKAGDVIAIYPFRFIYEKEI